MTRPQRMQWQLPDPVNPPDTICFQIKVPNEIHHIGAFYGAIYMLTYSMNWQRDDAHTAAEVSRVWTKIFDNLIAGNCTIPAKPGSAGVDAGDELMIRQNPDNPCLLETSVNGVDWCVWADLSLCTPAGPQPGTGTGVPDPGGCQTYHGVTGAAAPWYLPPVVSEGDTLRLVFSSGAWNDGGEVPWRLSNGDQFFNGNNVGNPTFSGSDPLPAEPHMAMLVLIDGVYYNIAAGTVTVPSGVANAQVLIQPNDDVLTNNAGDITFDLEYCNNQELAWTHTFNLLLAPLPSAFFTIHNGTSGPRGIWTPGVGYQPNAGSGGVNPSDLIQFDISGLPAQSYTGIKFQLDAGLPVAGYWQWFIGATDLTEFSAGESVHTITDSTSGVPTFMGVDTRDGSTCPNWTFVTFYGVGTDPF